MYFFRKSMIQVNDTFKHLYLFVWIWRCLYKGRNERMKGGKEGEKEEEMKGKKERKWKKPVP